VKRTIAFLLALTLWSQVALTQTPQKPAQEPAPDDVIRVTTQLVQTDVVVTDKDGQVVPNLKLEDFEIYDNGKKQELQFLEFVSVDGGRRFEGTRPPLNLAKKATPTIVEQTGNSGVSAKDLKRVIAFVVDDLSISIADLSPVRKMLLDFVDNKMREGDLVAIIRVIGSKGLLQQFTTDRQLLRRAIAAIRPVAHPFGSSNLPDPTLEKFQSPASSSLTGGGEGLTEAGPDSKIAADEPGNTEIFSSNDETIRYFRSLSAIITANLTIDSLKQVPGRKNLVLITQGIPLFEVAGSGSGYSATTSSVLSQLTDNAFRAGVAISSMDPRGLRASPGVVGFQETPARSAMGGGAAFGTTLEDAAFGRGGSLDHAVFGSLLGGGLDHLGLSTVAGYTGGVAVFNTNDFEAGLNKILARSSGYYNLGYRPTEKFDNKFHKLEVKVGRAGAKVYNHTRYLATEARTTGPLTREEEVAAAASSPLAKTDIAITPSIAIRLQPVKSTLEVHMQIGASKLHFTEAPTGTYHVSFDVVAFLFDQLGKRYGGLSETVNLNLSTDDYRRAMKEGLGYSAATELPPGYYQVRAVVREESSGNIGTFSKYLEVPDISKGKLAMSSVFLLAYDTQAKKLTPLKALRELSHSQDLRYVAMIYNPKLKDGKPQLRSQMIISQGSNVLFREPEQPVESNGSSPITKMGQLVLSRVAPGRYLLTLVITDTLADKKDQTLVHNIDFTVVN
jgi:VWFA-related protein